MEIHLTAFLNGVPHHARMPMPAGWAVRAQRIQSRRRTLAGTYITQFSVKIIAESEVAYDALVDADQAEIAREIDAGLAADDPCYLSDGQHVYLCIPDISVEVSTTPGKSRVVGKFLPIEEIL